MEEEEKEEEQEEEEEKKEKQEEEEERGKGTIKPRISTFSKGKNGKMKG